MSNHTAAPIALTCSECGVGHYYASIPWETPTDMWECGADCGHTIATRDVELESGEILTTDDNGALAYLPAAD